MRLWLRLLAAMMCWALLGCEMLDVDEDSEGPAEEETEAESEAKTEEEAQSDGFDLSTVRFLHANISGWAETASLSASVGGGNVVLDYDKSRAWPEVEGVVASAWVVFEHGGRWTAATFEYLRPGQTVKNAGFHIPIDGQTWRPSSGEEIGFIVSGLARDKRRTVEERSNVSWVRWP